MILKQFVIELMKKGLFNEQSKADIIYWAAHYENKMRLGDKAVIFIEAFLARCMLIINQVKSGNV